MPTQEPLYLRLYFQRHMTALVRLFGYNELSVMGARQKLRPLVELYGEQTMLAATEEIIEIDNSVEPAVARLTAQVRQLAVGILGPPLHEAVATNLPQVPSSDSVEGESSAPLSCDSPEEQATDETLSSEATPSKPVFLPRNKVLACYREWLVESTRKFIEIESAKPAIVNGAKLSTLDFVLYGDPPLLVTVRRSLTKRQRDHMWHWRRHYGWNHLPVRVWPMEGDRGWIWQQIPIEPSEEYASTMAANEVRDECQGVPTLPEAAAN